MGGQRLPLGDAMRFRVWYLGNAVLVEAGQECRAHGAKAARADVTSGQYPAAQKPYIPRRNGQRVPHASWILLG